MQHHPIASPTRTGALAVCLTALALVVAGPATARPDLAPQLSERSGQTATPPEQPQQLSEHGGQASATAAWPQVGDNPSERIGGPAPIGTAAVASTSTSSNDSDNAPLIIGLSLATTALLGGGVLVARRRRVAPGH